MSTGTENAVEARATEPHSGWVIVDSDDLDPRAAYRLLTGVVVPRPIAWITTLSSDGVVNLAPFSAFTLVANDPPMVGVNIGLRGGERKDTARNIHASGEYVVNIPRWDDRERVHNSARHERPETSEADVQGVRLLASDLVAPPRVADAPVSMECRLSQSVVFGRAGAEFTVGEVLRFHVRADLYKEGRIDTAALDPAARVAGPAYSRVVEVDTLPPVAGLG